MNKLTVIISLICFSLFAQEDSKKERWEELNSSKKYEKSEYPQGKTENKYIDNPTIHDKNNYYQGKKESVGFDNIDRSALKKKRVVKGNQVGEEEPPVEKKIKEISKEKETTPTRTSRRSSSNDRGINFNPNVSLIKFFLYLIAIILIAILVYHLIIKKLINYNPEVKAQTLVDEEILNPEVHEYDELENELNKCLENKDFRGAIRVHYLQILKQLTEKGKIKWKKEKTNAHYLREYPDSNSFSEFQFVINIFDRVWYGLRNISENEYKSVSQRILKFYEQLKNE